MKKDLILLVLVFVLSAVNVKSQVKNSTKMVTPEMLYVLIENQITQYNISSLSAAIVKGGRTVWKGNYGLANRETMLEANDSTIYLQYSITKTFTGLGLMQLYEKDSFELDDPINDHLPFAVIHPDYPSDEITFRMLMSHTSGIKDNWTTINNLMVYGTDTDIALDDFLQDYLVSGGAYYGANTSYTNSRPGTDFSYCNIGATLCGYLIENISGQDYKSYIHDNILSPIGMNNSFYNISECDENNMAVGYTYLNDYQTQGIISCPLIPAGFMRSDIDDMASYLTMLLDSGRVGENQIIAAELLDTMLMEHYPSIATNSGLLFGYDDQNLLWGHTGGYIYPGSSNNVKTSMFFDREEDWGVVVSSNGDGEPWQTIFMLYQYARDFESINPIKIIINDNNSDLILEANETVDLDITVRNNSIYDYHNIIATISCNNTNVDFNINAANLSVLNSSDTNTIPLNFQFNTDDFVDAYDAEFKIKFHNNSELIDSACFNIFFGEADILLIKDEEHLYRKRANASEYYNHSLVNCSKSVREYDINLFQVPDYTTLLEFDAVVWYTGLDNETYHNVITISEQGLIENYLDNGGNLFLSSQNISDKFSGTSFLNNYLKAEESNPAYTGTLYITGINTIEVSQALSFGISGGTGTSTQYSPSCISPLNGSEKLFNYYSTQNGAGVIYEGNYKLVFLPFCFAAIDNISDRDELMERIMVFFSSTVNYENIEESNVKIYPNPSDGSNINIQKLPEGKKILKLIDSNGKEVYKTMSFKNKAEFKSLNLEPGIYLLIINPENENIKHKVIIY